MSKGDSASTRPSDEQLLKLHREGDSGAFDTLMRRIGPEVLRFLVRFTGDRALAEDVFQETFLQVHLSAEGFDISRRLKPWLFTIAANKARDALRSRSRRKAAPLDAQIGGPGEESNTFVDLLEAEVDLPAEQLANTELRESVQQAVMEMPEHLRDVILLSYFHQFSYKDIADILQVPLGTVKSRLHAAVGQFARRWKTVARTFGQDDESID